jgi:tetratricopeptide (TPR) repeat protein
MRIREGAALRTRPALLWAAAAALGLGALPARAEDVAALLEQASEHRHRRRYEEALVACEEVVESAAATGAQKVEAFEIEIDVYFRQRRHRDAERTARRMFRELPAGGRGEQAARFALAHVYYEMRSYPRACASLRELIEKTPEDKAAVARARLRLAGILRERMKRHADAYEEAKKAASLDPENKKLVSDALSNMADAAWEMGDMEGCLEALERLLEPEYLEHRHGRDHRRIRERYTECLTRLGRHDLARERYAKAEKEEQDPERKQEYRIKYAETYVEEGNLREALEAYERVFTDYPLVSNRWHDAQGRIVEILRDMGDRKEALKAARIYLEGTRDHRRIGWAVRLAAELMAEADGNVERANAFLDFQRWGPAGEDGEPGTKDDLEDPLASVGYPRYPGRERTFAEARAKAGDSAWSARHRALTFVYTGRPEKALEFFVDAFRRAAGRELREAAHDMVYIGVRAARGHAAGIESVMKFVAHGPAGPDGRRGTGDDMDDPIAPLLR